MDKSDKPTPEQLARMAVKEAEARDIFKDIDWWMESKRLMKRRGSIRAKRTCPNCGGTVNMILAGPRQHIHGACETPKCIRIME